MPTTSGAPHGGAAPGAGAPPATQAPVIAASIGHYSGVAGPTLMPILKGTQGWVQFINNRGGLNGHPVKLLVYDDGMDIARHRAQAQDAVERQRAVVFLADLAPLTAQGSFAYLKEKGIPVVGTELATDIPYEQPMYFPQAPAGTAQNGALLAGAAQQMIPAGKTTLGTIVCIETPLCERANQFWREQASKYGFKMAYQAKSSLTQPDFTAECLSARNAGVEVLFIIMDSRGMNRISTACNRQGYHPVLATFGAILLDEMKTDPNLQNVIGIHNVRPYFIVDTPAMQEFVQGMTAAGLSPGIGQVTGWTAGKLLERAGRALPAGAPTSPAIFDGLWSIKNDDLGGLTYPLSFAPHQDHAPYVTCWWNVRIKDKAWESPDGAQRHCLNS